jgi:type I site-specific restriction endonuclease
MTEMSVNGETRELITQYMNLQKSAHEFAKKMDREIRGKDQNLKNLLCSLKRITKPHEESAQINMAQVTLNTKQIEKLADQIMSYSPKLDRISNLESLVETNENGNPIIIEKSKSIIEKSEKMADSYDVNSQTTNYLMTMVETQAMAGEMQSYAGSVTTINESSGHSMLQKLKNFAQRLKNYVGRIPALAKDAGEKLLEGIEAIPEKIKGGVNAIRESLTRILKEIADLIREFAVALIGGIFDLALWIQNIATAKKFSIKDFSIEIQPVEVDMVGPVPIAKFQTPKLTVSFEPTREPTPSVGDQSLK